MQATLVNRAVANRKGVSKAIVLPFGLRGTAEGAAQPTLDRIVLAWTREGADGGWGKALVSEGLSAAGSDWGARW